VASAHLGAAISVIGLNKGKSDTGTGRLSAEDNPSEGLNTPSGTLVGGTAQGGTAYRGINPQGDSPQGNSPEVDSP
jgi:hypothetical protein